MDDKKYGVDIVINSTIKQIVIFRRRRSGLSPPTSIRKTIIIKNCCHLANNATSKAPQSSNHDLLSLAIFLQNIASETRTRISLLTVSRDTRIAGLTSSNSVSRGARSGTDFANSRTAKKKRR